MDGFARRKEQSKEDIRKAAWELFSQFGVDKVTMNDIARKAGVSHATIYNNFGSKEVLIQEYAATMGDQLIDSIQAIMTPDKQFDEKMAAFFQFIAEMLSNNRLAGDNPIFGGSIDVHNDPEIKRVREAAQEKMAHLVMELVAEGKEEGQVNPSLSDAALALYFKMFMDMFVSTEFQLQFYQTPELMTDIGSLMMNGLRGSQPWE